MIDHPKRHPLRWDRIIGIPLVVALAAAAGLLGWGFSYDEQALTLANAQIASGQAQIAQLQTDLSDATDRLVTTRGQLEATQKQLQDVGAQLTTANARADAAERLLAIQQARPTPAATTFTAPAIPQPATIPPRQSTLSPSTQQTIRGSCAIGGLFSKLVSAACRAFGY